MNRKNFDLAVLPYSLAICRLDPVTTMPAWALRGNFFAVVKTNEELSVVCTESDVPAGTKCESRWRCFKVAGPLDFTLTGVLARIAEPLAMAGVSIFAISTYDTDYVLVKNDQLDHATRALREAGHQVSVG